MKISHLTPRFKPSIGGLETLVYETSKYLIKKGHSVKVYTSYLTQDSQKLKSFEIIDGIEIHRVSSFPLIPVKGGIINIMPKMLLDVLKDNSDIYHSYGLGSFPSVVGLIQHKLKKPVVITPISDLREGKMTQKIIDKATLGILKSTTKVIAMTQTEKRYLVKLGIDELKIEIIPLYSNYERFSKYKTTAKQFRKKYCLNKFVILYVGRIELWQKGIDYLIRALKELVNDFDITCVISGEDWGGKSNIQSLAKKLRVEKNLKFFDPKDQKFLGEAYHASDVLVLPSNFEPYGTVLIEAMGCGTPVIGTNVGGIVDVISDGKSGLLVPSKNPSALAKAITKLLENEKLRKIMGKNAKNQAKNYSVEIVGKKHLDLYMQLVNE